MEEQATVFEAVERVVSVLSLFYSAQTTCEERRRCEEFLEGVKRRSGALEIGCLMAGDQTSENTEMRHFGLSLIESQLMDGFVFCDKRKARLIEEAFGKIFQPAFDRQPGGFKEKSTAAFTLYQCKRWTQGFSTFLDFVISGFAETESTERSLLLLKSILGVILDHRKCSKEKTQGLSRLFSKKKETLIGECYRAVTRLFEEDNTRLVVLGLDLLVECADNLSLCGLDGIEPSVGEFYLKTFSGDEGVWERATELVQSIAEKKETVEECFLVTSVQSIISPACCLLRARTGESTEQYSKLISTLVAIAENTVLERKVFPGKEVFRVYLETMHGEFVSREGEMAATSHWARLVSSDFAREMFPMEPVVSGVLLATVEKIWQRRLATSEKKADVGALHEIVRKTALRYTGVAVDAVCVWVGRSLAGDAGSEEGLSAAGIVSRELSSAKIDEELKSKIEALVQRCLQSHLRDELGPVLSGLLLCIPDRDEAVSNGLRFFSERVCHEKKTARLHSLRTISSLFSRMSFAAVERNQEEAERVYGAVVDEEGKTILLEVLVSVALSKDSLAEKERIFGIATHSIFSSICSLEISHTQEALFSGPDHLQVFKRLSHSFLCFRQIIELIQKKGDDFLLSTIETISGELGQQAVGLLHSTLCFGNEKTREMEEACFRLVFVLTGYRGFYTAHTLSAVGSMAANTAHTASMSQILFRLRWFYDAFFERYPPELVQPVFETIFSDFVREFGIRVGREWGMLSGIECGAEEVEYAETLRKATVFLVEIVYKVVEREGRHLEGVLESEHAVQNLVGFLSLALEWDKTDVYRKVVSALRRLSRKIQTKHLSVFFLKCLRGISDGAIRDHTAYTCDFLCEVYFQACLTECAETIEEATRVIGEANAGLLFGSIKKDLCVGSGSRGGSVSKPTEKLFQDIVGDLGGVSLGERHPCSRGGNRKAGPSEIDSDWQRIFDE
ncbi:MAG: uncharacterized protein A8A55_1361 [Amphiamblys sp. WSBS2006]|nr:MAG: uncharacterized protein A8A55_1361 [Amphiamblys sp. WSBS2006]